MCELASASLQAQDPERDCINDFINLDKKRSQGWYDFSKRV